MRSAPGPRAQQLVAWIDSWVAGRFPGAAPRVVAAVQVLLRGLSAGLLGSLVGGVAGTFAQVLLVRKLGSELFGEYATLSATLAIMASLLGIGLDTWTLHDSSRHPEHVTRNVWHALLLKGCVALLLLTGLAVAQSSRIALTTTFVVGVIGIIVESFAATGFSALRALRRNEWVAALQTVGPIMLLLVLLALQQAPGSVLVVIAVQTAISALVSVLTLRKVWQIAGTPRRERHVIRRMIKGAWLFVVSEILSTLYLQSAIAILGNTGDENAAGALRAAQNAVAYTLIAPTLLFVTALPLLNDPNLDRRGYRTIVGMMLVGALVYGLAAGGATYLLAPRVIASLYGAEFSAAIPLLQQFWFVPLVRSGSLIGAAVLLSHGRTRLRVQLQLLVVLANVGLGVLLIPSGGAAAAFLVITITELIVLALYTIATLIIGRRLRL